MCQPSPHLDRLLDPDLTGLRIGVYRPWFEDASPEVVDACTARLDDFCEAGARVIDVEVPDLELCRIAHTVSITSEMVTATEPAWREHRTDFGLDIRVNTTVARTFTSRDYVRAQQTRTRMVAIFASLFEDVDLIATPTTGITAPPISPGALGKGESNLEMLSAIMRFAFPANLCGNPAISFPAGYDSAGLPIGFQAMGRPWEEHNLLRLAQVAESRVPTARPQVHFPLLSSGSL